MVIWAMPCKNMSSGICKQQRPCAAVQPGQACTSAQSDQGISCQQTESLSTIKCFNGERIPGLDGACAG